MMKEILLWAGSFGLCAALGSIPAGCGDEGGGCPAMPAAPAEKDPVRITSVRDSPNGAHPDDGTFAITGKTVVIRYEDEGVNHEVIYTLGDPLF